MRRPNRGRPRRKPKESLVGVGLPRFELRAIGGMFNLAVMTPYRMMRMVEQVVRQQLAVIGLADKPPRYFDAPTTRFNAPLSPHRRISGSRVPLDRVKAVKDAFGVKVNDVVLAMVCGALRSYLAGSRGASGPAATGSDTGIHPRRSMTMTTTVGNQITSTTVSLPTDVSDPTQRLEAIHASAQGAKAAARALTANQIVGLTETAPPGVLALAARAYTAGPARGERRPDQPRGLQRAGSRLPDLHGRRGAGDTGSDRSAGDGRRAQRHLFQLSGSVDFGFVTTPEIAKDIDELADGIEPALRELEQAAED